MTFHEPLTREEAEVIRKSGKAMRELATGIRRPQSPAQERFMRVCCGKEAPVTIYEIAYMKNFLREQELARQSGKDQGPDEQKRRVRQHTASTQPSDSTQRQNQPKKTSRAQKSFENQEGRAQKLMNQMLAQSVWLWVRDERFLASISAQLSEGRELSGKQILAIERAYERFVRNQQPRVFRG